MKKAPFGSGFSAYKSTASAIVTIRDLKTDSPEKSEAKCRNTTILYHRMKLTRHQLHVSVCAATGVYSLGRGMITRTVWLRLRSKRSVPVCGTALSLLIFSSLKRSSAGCRSARCGMPVRLPPLACASARGGPPAR